LGGSCAQANSVVAARVTRVCGGFSCSKATNHEGEKGRGLGEPWALRGSFAIIPRSLPGKARGKRDGRKQGGGVHQQAGVTPYFFPVEGRAPSERKSSKGVRKKKAKKGR